MRSQYSASSMKWVVMMIVDAACGKRRDAPPELAPRQRIGAAGGFVQKQDLGLVQQAGGHRQALLEAAGQLAAVANFPCPPGRIAAGRSRMRSRRRSPCRP